MSVIKTHQLASMPGWRGPNLPQIHRRAGVRGAEAASDTGRFAEAAQAAFRQDGSVVAVWRSLSPAAVMWSVRAP